MDEEARDDRNLRDHNEGQDREHQRLTLEGVDNYGAPRQHFADTLAASDDEQFLKLAEEYIWLSAYAANNPRSDYHWKCDATYAEAKRRGKPELYDQAWHRVSGM